MSIWPKVSLGDLMPSKVNTVDPRREPDTLFSLHSIPAYDAGRPLITLGHDIGSAKKIVKPGDVLLSRIVPHIRRSWSVGDDSVHPLIASTEWMVFRSELFHPAYLEHLLTSDGVHRQVMASLIGVGGSLMRANPASVSKIEIPLPPLEEQRRIAQSLDRARAAVGAYSELRGRVSKIARAQFQKIVSADSWKVQKLGDVAEFVRGITFPSGVQVPPSTPKSILCMRTSNVQEELDLSDVWALPETYCPKSPGKYLREGDILVSTANSWNLVGKCCLVPQLSRTSTFGGFISALRPLSNDVQPTFLYYWFSHPLTQARVRNTANQTTSIANVGLKRCAQIPLPVPPRQIQLRFESDASKVALLSSRVDEAVRKGQELYDSLQYRAFRGEL